MPLFLHFILYLGIILFTIPAATAAPTQRNSSRDKNGKTATPQTANSMLILWIAIEDLQPDYLDLLQSRMCADGFNLFSSQGLVIDNVDFGTPLDFTASLALLATGTSPSTNGIPAQIVYDRENKVARHIYYDPSVMGNNTHDTYSPTAISTSTICDESRIAGGGVTYVHSIAADPAPAITMSAHSANSAVWLNTSTGKWASTTWYTDLPNLINNRNRLSPLSARLDTMSWTPIHTPDYYIGLPSHLTHYPFHHTIAKNESNRFLQFANTPLINREITNIAIEYIHSLSLGTHDGADMLNVAYSLRPYTFSKKSDVRYELMDSYYRLDKDIARLISAARNHAGADNVMVFLTATPLSRTVPPDDPIWKLPSGSFSTRKAESLLNLYLMANHGNKQWVQNCLDGDFYLDHKLIADSGKDLQAMRAQAAEFLSRMAGVYNVYTIDRIIAGQAGENAQALRRNTSVRHSGDLRVSVLPGWQLIDDASGYVDPSDAGVYRAVAPTAPVMIYHPHIPGARITEPIDARRIAPTIARVLHMRAPNAAMMPPLELK